MVKAPRQLFTGPRPLPGLVPSVVSGTALAATGHLGLPVLAVFAGALAGAAWAGARGVPGIRSGLLLNTALAGVLATCLLLVASGGHPLVALAHFTLGAGGLLLLDGRPRRSEYPLVSLSLFQVVLASSLTDSLLFPLLLAAYLLALVFALASHSVERAALEAGLPRVDPGLRRGLLRPTLRASILALGVAAVLFALLPRLRAGAVLGGALPGGAPRAGLSERMELGDLGPIRRDASVALRVEHLSGAPASAPAYYRAIALEHFDGRGWSVGRPRRAPLPGSAEGGLALTAAGRPGRVERILREPVAGGVLLLPRGALFVQGRLGRLERDRVGNVFAPRTLARRVVYTVAAEAAPPDDRELRSDRLSVPPGGEHLLDLPPLSPEIGALAQRLAGGAASPADADRARALEGGLRRLGRYRDRPPELPPGDPRSPVEIFLTGELAGHCEYFATAMAVLARSLGMPARVVTGFAGGSPNRFGGFLELRRSDAHAWVELHYEKAGWVRYDPTPPAALVPGRGPTLAARLRELADAVEHLWFRKVVELDRGDQMRAVAAAWVGGRRAAAAAAEHLPALGAGLLAGSALVLVGRRRRRRLRTRAAPAPYARALRQLARAGHRPPRGAAPRATVRHLSPALPAEAARALARITEACLAHRYGGRPLPPLEAELRRLRDSLRA